MANQITGPGPIAGKQMPGKPGQADPHKDEIPRGDSGSCGAGKIQITFDAFGALFRNARKKHSRARVHIDYEGNAITLKSGYYSDFCVANDGKTHTVFVRFRTRNNPFYEEDYVLALEAAPGTSAHLQLTHIARGGFRWEVRQYGAEPIQYTLNLLPNKAKNHCF